MSTNENTDQYPILFLVSQLNYLFKRNPKQNAFAPHDMNLIFKPSHTLVIALFVSAIVRTSSSYSSIILSCEGGNIITDNGPFDRMEVAEEKPTEIIITKSPTQLLEADTPNIPSRSSAMSSFFPPLRRRNKIRLSEYYHGATNGLLSIRL